MDLKKSSVQVTGSLLFETWFFSGSYFGPDFFYGHNLTHVVKTRIEGADWLGVYVLIGLWTFDLKQIKLETYVLYFKYETTSSKKNCPWYSKMGLFKFPVGFFHFH